MILAFGSLLLGIVILTYTVFTSVSVYLSLGYSGFEKWIFIIVGFVIPVMADTMPAIILSLIELRKFFLAVSSSVVWVVAVVMVIVGEIGFMSQATHTVAMNSESANIARQEAARLDARISENAGALAISPEKIKREIEQKRYEYQKVSNKLLNCPENHVTKCIDPLTNKLGEISEQIRRLESNLKEVSQVEGLKRLKLEAEQRASAVDSVPVWYHTITRLTGGDPKTVQAKIACVTALLIQALGMLCFIYFSIFRMDRKGAEIQATVLYENAKVFKPRKCVECGKMYVPKQSNQRFCSSECRRAAQHRNSQKTDGIPRGIPHETDGIPPKSEDVPRQLRLI